MKYDYNLYKTAQTRAVYIEENLPQMKYADMHCDTLTECSERGYSVTDCPLQINLKKLNKNGCAVQCFAIFTQGADAALRFEKYLDFYKEAVKTMPAVLDVSDFERCMRSGETGIILTVENLGFTGGDLSRLDALEKAGVRMASLVWNYENQFAYPNLIFKDGVPRFREREKRGLKNLGKEAAERLDALKIIVDISHLSDGGAEDILTGRKIPLVASHSNCASVCDVSRNLTDGQLKKISDCGGVVGINFCKDFLGGGDTYALIAEHLAHLIKVGGEDIAAFGSDFDGIPPAPDLEDCAKMPPLLEFLEKRFSPRVMEKLCYKNFARVFADVCGRRN